jgi:hypothetical protein
MAAPVEQPAAPAKPKRRIVTYLIVGILLLATPVATWFALDLFKKPEAGGGASGTNVVKAAPRKNWVELNAPNGMAIPLVRTQIVFIKANPALGYPPFVAPMNLQPARTMEKMMIRLADTNEVHHAVGQFHLVGKNTDLLIDRLNRGTNAAALYDEAFRLISNMTFKQARSSTFRNLLRAHLSHLCDRILGTNVVHEVLAEFVTQ